MGSTYPEIRTLGLDALIVRFSGELDDAANRAALSFAGALNAQELAGVTEVASSLTSVFLRFDPAAVKIEDLMGQVEGLLSTQDWMAANLPKGRKLWTVPVALGGQSGPQFDEAASVAGQSGAALAEMIEAAQVRVLALGFAPGQPYMGMLPEQWNIPRMSSVTPEVPAGALVMAVRQLIIFAGPAPTGWRQIGVSGFRPFRPDAANPITLTPGDEMRFQLVSSDMLAGEGDGLGGATFEIMP